MASLLLPGICLFALAFGVPCVGEEPAPLATRDGVVPLASPADIVALAASNRERWQEPKGGWEFKPDRLTGSGDSRIAFRGPFKPPFALAFRLKVLKGMRPRVYVGPLTFANRGYERTLAFYPNNGDGVPLSYEENREYAVNLAIEPDGARLAVDGRNIMTATLPVEEVREIGFSSGDWWSKGAVCFSDIIIRFPATLPPPTQPEASPVKTEFERDVAALAVERKAAGAQLAREYAGVLDALVHRLNEDGRTTLAAAARQEKARVEAGVEITEEKVSRAPFEVLTARAAYLAKVRNLNSDFDIQAAQRAARYLGALEKATASPVSEEALAARILLEKERSRLPQVSQSIAKRPTKRTLAASGEGGGPFEEVAQDEALLSGLILHTGDFAGHEVLVAIQPIFRTTTATRLGTLRGVPRGTAVRLEAEPGYAIGGLSLHSGDRVDGLEIVFMKVKPGGLDPADFYKSTWVGGKGGGPVEISGNGNAIIGLYGATGSEFDSLGLIEVPQPADGGKEGTRDNPAAVNGSKAQPVDESSTRETGK
jgi:hypothetical protein